MFFFMIEGAITMATDVKGKYILACVCSLTQVVVFSYALVRLG